MSRLRALLARPRGWWRSWVTLLSRREPAVGLACFRVAIGLVLLYSLLSVGLGGLIDVLWVDVAHGGYKPLGRGAWIIPWLGGPTPAVVHGVYAAALAGALLVTVGLGGRLATFATLHLYLALITLNGEASGGYDLLLTNALWLLVLGDSTATLSLRCRLRAGRWIRSAAIPAWPRYLAVFQLVVMYTATGLQKLSADWTPAGGYMALYYVFQDPTWRRFDMGWVAWVTPLTQAATAVTWLFEVSAPLLFLVYYFRYTRERPGRVRALINRRDLRVLFMATGVCLHVGILVTLDVGPFSWVTLAYYLCLWHPDELARGLQRVRRRLQRIRPGPDERPGDPAAE